MFEKLQNIFWKTKGTFVLPKEYEQLLKEKIENNKLQLFVELINEHRYRKELNATLKMFLKYIDKFKANALEMYKRMMITHDKILIAQYEPFTMGLVALLTKMSENFERSGKINKALQTLQIAVDLLYKLCPTTGEERKGIYHTQLAFLLRKVENIEDAKKEAERALKYLSSDRDELQRQIEALGQIRLEEIPNDLNTLLEKHDFIKKQLKRMRSREVLNNLQEKLKALDVTIVSLKEINNDINNL
ncbi:MAG: hypothetical protein AB1633_12370 [Elusimicrobiota bacterium]